jgi:hypothetical protein
MEESTFLSRSFADQGLKIRIRKELRQRRKLSKISDTEDKDTNLITPSPTSTMNSKKVRTYKRISDESSSTPSAIPSSNSNMTTSTASTTTPTLSTATTSNNSMNPHHYRIDLPPNPTRYISYSSKQQDGWSPSPQSSSPVNATSANNKNSRYYAQEESSNPNIHHIDRSNPQQPVPYFINSDPYNSHSQQPMKYSLPSQPPPSSSHVTQQQQQRHEVTPLSYNTSRNPSLFYYPSTSLPPPPTSIQQQHQQHRQHHLQQLPLPPPPPPSSSHPSQHLPPPS